MNESPKGHKAAFCIEMDEIYPGVSINEGHKIRLRNVLISEVSRRDQAAAKPLRIWLVYPEARQRNESDSHNQRIRLLACAMRRMPIGLCNDQNVRGIILVQGFCAYFKICPGGDARAAER